MSRFQIRNCINPFVAVVKSEATIQSAEEVILADHSPELYIVDNQDELIGIVPDYELLKYSWLQLPKSHQICSIMSPISIAMTCTDSIEKIVKILSSHIHPRVPVLEGRKLLGIIDRISVIQRLLASHESAEAVPSELQSLDHNLVPTPKFLKTGNSCGLLAPELPHNP